jgi:hypothetical protein
MAIIGSLFEGMDTPDGLVFGSASLVCIAGPFFPMFPSLRAIFPPPLGWGAAKSMVLATFACVCVKAFMHSFGRGLRFHAEGIKMCGIFWLVAFIFHYTNKASEFTQDHDPVSLIIYAALFGVPTYAFSAMQLHAGGGRGDA